MALWKVNSPKSTSHAFTKVVPEDVLAEFDVPLTFTFSDDRGSTMLAHLSAVGIRTSRYLVCPTNQWSINELRSGIISVHSALGHQPLWLADVGPDGTVISAWETVPSELPAGALPEPDALLTAELEEAQAKDDKIALFKESRNAARVAFDGGPVSGHEIEARFFGLFVQKASELLVGICAFLNAPSPKLRLGMTMPSSYAIDMNVADREEAMFADNRSSDIDKINEAFELLVSLMVDGQPPQQALTLVKRVYHLRQQYGGILELISNNAVTVAIRTRKNPRSRKMSGMEAGERLKLVRDLGYPFMHLNITGTLISGSIEKVGRTTPHFAIRVDEAGQSEVYQGSISNEAIEQMRSPQLGDQVKAKLQLREEAGDQKYVLTGIAIAPDEERHSVT